MVWIEIAVFALFIVAGSVWILSIYAGIEEEPSNAVLFGLWTGVMVFGAGVAVHEWLIPNPTVPAVAGAVIGIGLTVMMYEPEFNAQQNA